MMNGVVVGIGGFIGAICRYVVSEWLDVTDSFPFATLCINVIGCFFLSLLLTSTSLKWSPKVKLAVTTGFFGAFTTFSSFSLETLQFLQQGAFLKALIYVFCSIAFGLGASAIGYYVAKVGWTR